ncbi:MAG TPA: hypothetical protein VGW34_12550 [Allosphingosinicella sp.]|nr:hypothetical protein [Allosphingosinicella sp.]
MTPEHKRPEDEAIWRNRFILMNLTRIGGTLVVLFGLFVWHSDWWRSGGAIEIGLPLALLGLAISFGGPKYLAQKWRTPDR